MPEYIEKNMELTDTDIYLSTCVFPFEQIADVISYSLEHSFDRLELGSTIAHSPDLLGHIRKAHGQIQFLIHNYFPPPVCPFVLNLAATTPDVHSRSVDLCRKAIDMAAELGAPFYSVHAGFAFHLMPEMLGDTEAQCRVDSINEISPEDAYRRFVDTVSKLGTYAKSNGVGLLIENNVIVRKLALTKGEDILLLTTDTEILRFMKDVNDSNVGLLLDTGHLNVSAHTLGFDRMSFIDKVAPYIKAIHVHDNDGATDAHQPIEPTSWVLDILRKPEFAALPLVIEAKFESTTELCRHVEWLRNEIQRK